MLIPHSHAKFILKHDSRAEWKGTEGLMLPLFIHLLMHRHAVAVLASNVGVGSGEAKGLLLPDVLAYP